MRHLLRCLTTVTVLVCACQGRSYSAPQPPGVATSVPSTFYAGDTLPDLTQQGIASPGGTLRVAIDSEPVSLNYQLDPPDTWGRKIGGMILDSLAAPNPQTWQPEPHLAERWVIDADQSTFTFYLKRGLRWDDGAPFGVDDVIYTFEILRQASTRATGARLLLTDLEAVQKIDDTTVRFRFKRPNVYAFDIIAETAIYPRHVYVGGDFNSHPANRSPVGMGPYRILKWLAGDKIILTRNDRYWGKPAFLQDIIFKVVTDPDRRLALLRHGDLDVIERMSPKTWLAASRDPQISQAFWRLRHVPSSLQWIGWNEKRPFFQSPVVRRALSMLLDREAIVREVRLGSDTVAASWFYPGAKEYNADIPPWPFDPNGAMELLDAAGWQDHDNDRVRDQHGMSFAFTLLYPAGNPMYDDLSDMIRTSFAHAGIQVEAQAVPWSVYTDRLGRGAFDACLSLWHMVPRSDPFVVWHSTSTGTAGFNFIGYANGEADKLLEDARVSPYPNTRIELYHRFSDVLHRDEPYSMLFHRYNLSLVSKHFGGIYSTPYGILRYESFFVR